MNSASVKPFGVAAQSDSQTDKYVTFKLADYLFALPSEKILKIVATPPPSQGGMVSMGLVQLEQYSIQMLDLAKLLNLQIHSLPTQILSTQNLPTQGAGAIATSSKIATATGLKTPLLTTPLSVAALDNPPFLIVLQGGDEQLWGIAVNEPPDLLDIPRYALKPVPSEKRLTRALRWVSHVVTYDLGCDRHTLLLLDISVLISPEQAAPALENFSFQAIEPPFTEENISARKSEMYA
jgi:chemotaxis signal transduction protein